MILISSQILLFFLKKTTLKACMTANFNYNKAWYFYLVLLCVSWNKSCFKFNTVSKHALAIPVTYLGKKYENYKENHSYCASPTFRWRSVTLRTVWASRRLQKKKPINDCRGQRKQCLKAVKKLAAIQQTVLDSADDYSTSLFLESPF